MVEALFVQSLLVDIAGQLKLCRDQRDDMFLDTAITGGAGYLISRDDDLKGDSDLMEQMRAHGVKVITVSHFLSELANEQA
jgi:putative PIN family toxin of toxin-antitoxin system